MHRSFAGLDTFSFESIAVHFPEAQKRESQIQRNQRDLEVLNVTGLKKTSYMYGLQSSTGCQCLPVSLASIRITCPFGLDTCVSTYNCVMQFGNRGLTFCVT